MYVHRPDARIFYQVTGSGARDLFLLPQCQVVTYSRMWKYQIPYLSRYFRVITMDPRGNGRSDRPSTGYDLDTRYADFTAVLDEVVRTPFALVAFSCAAPLAFKYAVEHPERLSHLILLSGQFAESMPQPFEERVARVIRDDFDAWRQRLFRRVFPEPHSLKGMEDGIAWAGETSPHILVDSLRRLDGINLHDLLGRVHVPTLALHGTQDKIVPYTHAQAMVAALPRARLVTFEQGGHGLFGRDAVKVNRLIRDFVLDRTVTETTIPATTARAVPPDGRRGASSARRAAASAGCCGSRARSGSATSSAISRSPAGCASDIRRSRSTSSPPIPADRVVEHWGERLHPATRLLQNESAHFEGWAADHELHAFNALWDMDEIMMANFMTFADVVERESYDLWVGDEGWDLDYYLHENPELKRAPYVFLTDFIGVLPMRDDRTSTEFIRCWEKNAENIDHLRHHPDVRDLSILIGEEADVLDREFGPDLPNMRAWAREHFRFSGYTYHFDPTAFRDRQALRRELGYREDERVILVSVGGTQVGRNLLRKCARAFELVASADPRHADGSGRGAAARRGRPGLSARGSTCARSCRTSSGITRRPISRSCRAGSRPRWSWRPFARRSSTSRSGITSSSRFTWRGAWTASEPARASTTTGRPPKRSAQRSSTISGSPSTARRCRSTAPTGPPG